ncbi:Hypp1474 [Branchiostoma lanceolatum]|uniref:Hypp1474 protein n=1 Tax=Branchiostoma lanceolatum TaxID=7740 RepID=A0A8K0EKZ7_BRALA|nr:Hypp1474 [Branchiostoma lanceolatum]
MITFVVFTLMCALSTSSAQSFTKPPSPSTPLISTTVSLPKLPSTTSADQLITTPQDETTPRGVTAGASTPDTETSTTTGPPGTDSTTEYSSPAVQGLQTWEIALIATGASLGGILIIGGVGFGIYKACDKRKSARVGSHHEMESQEQQGQKLSTSPSGQ